MKKPKRPKTRVELLAEALNHIREAARLLRLLSRRKGVSRPEAALLKAESTTLVGYGLQWAILVTEWEREDG